MGTTRDFLASGLADTLLPLLRRAMEDTVLETLDDRQVPTRTDFKEVRDLVNALRGQVGGTTKGIERLVARLDQLDARIAKLEAAVESGLTQAASPKVCQVPGCNAPVRSKGFCGRHYQQWRRGRLEGFPPPR
jgi:hypothetical protein